MFLHCNISRFQAYYSPLSCFFSAIFPGFNQDILGYHVPSLSYSQVSILIFSFIIFLLCHIPRFQSWYSPLSCSFTAIFPGFHPDILHYHVPSLPYSQVSILIFSIILFLLCRIPRFQSWYSPSSCSFSSIFPGFNPDILHHHVPSLPYSQVSIIIFSIIMFLLCHIPRFPSSYYSSSCSFFSIFPGFNPHILHHHVPSLPCSQVSILILFIIMLCLFCHIPGFPS